MKQKILSIFTRTPIHVGAGNSVGAVDSPVMRERHTRFPIIPGSSLKGVLRDRAVAENRCWLFGNDQGETDKEKVQAGALLIGEGRTLAFPVRSARGGFAWITCPLTLARYKRDAGVNFEVPEGIEPEECLASSDITFDGKVILEEYCLTVNGEAKIWQELKSLCDDEVWKDLGKRFVIVSDEMFSHFCEHACEVVTRVRIDDETGTVAKGALFNQENVPSETMFYSVIAAQAEKTKGDKKRTETDALSVLQSQLTAVGNCLQIGGDETIGLGFCTVTFSGEEADR